MRPWFLSLAKADQTLTVVFAEKFQASQAISQFGTQLSDSKSVLDRQLAGKRRAFLSPVSEVERYPAILAVFVPTEPSIGDRLGRQILKTSQQRVVFRDLKFLPENRDFHQAREGLK